MPAMSKQRPSDAASAAPVPAPEGYDAKMHLSYLRSHFFISVRASNFSPPPTVLPI